MKKKKVLLIGTMAVALLIGNEVVSQENESTDGLLLENAEALASGEWENKIHCFGVGCVDCPLTHSKVEYYFSGFSLD